MPRFLFLYVKEQCFELDMLFVIVILGSGLYTDTENVILDLN